MAENLDRLINQLAEIRQHLLGLEGPAAEATNAIDQLLAILAQETTSFEKLERVMRTLEQFRMTNLKDDLSEMAIQAERIAQEMQEAFRPRDYSSVRGAISGLEDFERGAAPLPVPSPGARLRRLTRGQPGEIDIPSLTEQFKLDPEQFIKPQLDKVGDAFRQLSDTFQRDLEKLRSQLTDLEISTRAVTQNLPDPKTLLNLDELRTSVFPELQQLGNEVQQAIQFEPISGTPFADLQRELNSVDPQRLIERFEELQKESQDLNAPLDDLAQKMRDIQAAEDAAGQALQDWAEKQRQAGEESQKAAEKIEPLFQTFEQLANVLPGGARAAESVLQLAQQYGFDVENISKKVSTEAVSGMSRVTFSAQEADRTFKQLTLTVDKAGNAIADSQKRFRTFFGGIIRNMQEALKWGIAINIVYAPIRRFNELLEVAIENESRLADIGVVLGRSHENLDEIFQQAATAAEITGESINGVLDGYAQAFRATGRIADETERSATAQQLLIDSLVLSKLSTLDQATAMDTLIGALQQAGLGLDEGSELLDKWVRVSRFASVDLKTLAESFAITATSAEGAGVDVDKLNGIIATVAEVTTLSATEAGNAVRAFISGFQTDSAQKELAQYGIAVEDAQGKTRGFVEVIEQLVAFRREGLIDDQELNRIGEAIGGGARRGAQVVAFIENYGRTLQVAAESAKANGDAQDALDIKLGTLQTSLQRLGNAFQEFSQTLGQDGGIIDLFRILTDFGTDLVNVMSDLTRVLGNAAPVLGALGVARFVGGRNFFPQAAEGFGGIGRRLATPLATAGILRGPQREGLISTSADNVANAFQRNAATIGSALAVAFIAGMNLKEGDTEAFFGSAIGGALGLLAGGPIGGLLGTSIGEGFVNYVRQQSETELGVYGFGIPEPERIRPDLTAPSTAELQESELFKAAGGGFEFLGRALSIGLSKVDQALTKLGLAQQTRPEGLGALDPRGAAFALGFLRERISGADLGLDEIRETEEALLRLQEAQDAVGETAPEFRGLDFTRDMGEFVDEYSQQLSRIIEESRNATRTALQDGEITQREFTNRMDTITTGLDTTIAQVYVALGDNAGDATEEIDRLVTLLLESEPDTRQFVLSLANDINLLANQIEVLSEAGDPTEELEKRLAGLTTTLDDTLSGIESRLSQVDVQLPSIIRFDELDTGELEQILARAQALQAEFFRAALEEGLIPDEQFIDEYIDALEPLFIQLEDRFRAVYGVRSDFLQQARGELEGEGAIGTSSFGVRQLDIPSSRRGELEGALQFADQLLNQLGYQQDPQKIGLIFSDYVTEVLHVDNLKLQLALQQLVDINEKQLDGIYNLPTDATFFVPWTGAKLAIGQGRGGGFASAVAGGQEPSDTEEAIPVKLHFEEMDWLLQMEAALSGFTTELNEVVSKFPKESLEPEDKRISKVGGELELTEEKRLRRELLKRAEEQNIQRDPLIESLNSVTTSLSEIGTDIANSLTELFTSLFGILPGTGGQDADTTTGLQIPDLSTALQLDISNNTNVILDGAVVAAVVRDHLVRELITYEGTGGSTVRTFALT